MLEPTTLFVLVSLLLFSVGILSGWLLTRDGQRITESRLQVAIGIIVTIVWVVSIAAEILIPTYTVSLIVHGIMGAVVGYLFSDEGLTINFGRR